MNALKLNDSLYWVGVLDKDLRVFDIIMHTEFGTTYNSYVLKGSEKSALFESAKEVFFDDYLETVTQITPIENIEYVIVDHTEPDHAGSIAKLLDINPNIKVVGSATAITFLKHIVNRDFYSVVVGDGDSISLGDKTIRFYSVPNLHWPDTIYSHIEEDNVLVTCDSFGSHYAHDGILRSTVTDYEGYMRATKYYFDNILGPFKQPYMADALRLVREELKPVLICPGHGPVLDSHLEDLYAKYDAWCQVEEPTGKKVVIPYVSAYGYTGQLAEEIMKGLAASGDFEVKSYDLVVADKAEVLAELAGADGILLGSPTILQEALNPIWDLTINMYPPIHGGKFAAAFGSYGWSGEAVDHLTERLKQLNMKVMKGLKIRLKPDETDLTDAYDFGYAFGCFMQRKDAVKPVGNTGLVKCLICGEVFDASLTICPTCGVGEENFVPVEANVVTYRNDTERTYVILGSGRAAVSAAEAIRARDESGYITMVSLEKETPYNRTLLTKAMFANLEPKDYNFIGPDWFEKMKVRRVNGVIAELNAANKKVVLADGRAIEYDKCIYALGSYFFVPPFEGCEDSRVTTIRTLQDLEKVKGLLESGKEAVLVGGGVVGLEAAWELKKYGCNVTVLEAAPSLMANKLDPAASGLLQKLVEKSGIRVIVNAATEKYEDGEIVLKDGTRLPANVVVVSCGVRANSLIAEAAGVKVNRAIVVNDRMETNVPGVYAAGDCAEFEGMNYALWPEADNQGKAAGANAAGDDVRFVSETYGMTMHLCNTELYAIGKTSGNEPFRTVEFLDPVRGTLKKYFFLHNVLCGVTLIGDTSDLVRVTDLVNSKVLFDEVFPG